MVELYNSVEELLLKKNVRYTKAGKNFLINCLNPEHEDRNPSCAINIISGATHCFSCGWKVNIFRHFNVNVPVTFTKVRVLKEKLTKIIEKHSLKLEDKIPFNKSFRGISLKTLTKFDAFYIDPSAEDPNNLENRIIFPIKDVAGSTVVYVGRHLYSNVKDKYRMYPRGIPPPIYPAQATDAKLGYVVLVEGIFDMLNLHDKGLINTSCIFGVSTITSNNVKEKLMVFRAQNIHTIFLLLDPDEAGRKAAKELRPLVESEGFIVHTLDCPDGKDPGDMTQDEILKLKASIDEYCNN